MTDLERLDEALRWWERLRDSTEWRPAIPVAFNAARAYRDLLANAERVEWCVPHGAAVPPGQEAWCDVALAKNYQGCSIVSRLLVDPPKEEER